MINDENGAYTKFLTCPKSLVTKIASKRLNSCGLPASLRDFYKRLKN